MLIKYCVKDSNNYELMKITGAERLDNGSVVFTALRTDMYDIMIENISDSEFYEIFKSLFYEERADLTAYKNRTTYYDDSDE